MAVAAAECIQSDQLVWLAAHEAFPEQHELARAEAAEFVGRVALRSEVRVVPVEIQAANTSTLKAAVEEATFGDKDALQVVKNNVGTDVSERMFKVGQSRVDLQVVNRRFTQNGRDLTDVHRNTLLYTTLNGEMLHRTRGELGNGILCNELLPTGILDTHNVLVFEPASTNPKTRKDYGFFEGTESCSVQMLSADGDAAALETALVAGKRTPVSPRHDMAAIHMLAHEHGLTMQVDEIGDMIQYIMLVPKGAVPNGISDVVTMYDQAVGGTFFGQASDRRDYMAFADECRQRDEAFAGTVEAVTQKLLAEAGTFESPLHTIQRLDYWSEKLCVQHAVKHADIDTAVFGAESAGHIADARFFLARGDLYRAEYSLQKAEETADSSSCPFLKFETATKEGQNPDGSKKQEEASGLKSINCPFCNARVLADPCAEKISCSDCLAFVYKGKAREGNGGSKKRHAERAARRAEQSKHKLELAKQAETQEPQEHAEPPADPAQQAGQLALAGVQSEAV